MFTKKEDHPITTRLGWQPYSNGLRMCSRRCLSQLYSTMTFRAKDSESISSSVIMFFRENVVPKYDAKIRNIFEFCSFGLKKNKKSLNDLLFLFPIHYKRTK